MSLITARVMKILGAISACQRRYGALYDTTSVARSVGADPRDAKTDLDSKDASPIHGVRIRAGYRDWKLISVTHEERDFNQLHAQLRNDLAISTYRDGKLPFPDDSVIVALHRKRVASDQDNRVLGREQAFVAGSSVNMQVMVKDSRKYAATGGWGFGDFKDGSPSDRAVHEKCFSRHTPAKDGDYIYTHYAP